MNWIERSCRYLSGSRILLGLSSDLQTKDPGMACMDRPSTEFNFIGGRVKNILATGRPVCRC